MRLKLWCRQLAPPTDCRQSVPPTNSPHSVTLPVGATCRLVLPVGATHLSPVGPCRIASDNCCRLAVGATHRQFVNWCHPLISCSRRPRRLVPPTNFLRSAIHLRAVGSSHQTVLIGLHQSAFVHTCSRLGFPTFGFLDYRHDRSLAASWCHPLIARQLVPPTNCQHSAPHLEPVGFSHQLVLVGASHLLLASCGADVSERQSGYS